MLYLFTSEDADRRRAAADALVAGLARGTDIVRMNRESFSPEDIENLLGGAGLFAEQSAAVLSEAFELAAARDFLLARLDRMATSPNNFIFIEPKLLKPVLDAFRAAGARVAAFDKGKERKERFNSFALANSLAVRDRFGLWLGFRQALRAGVSTDELAGVLFWKAKDMLLKRSYGKFTEAELVRLAGSFSSLLAEARSRSAEEEESLERFLLEAF